MSTIKSRASKILSLDNYDSFNYPEYHNEIDLQYIPNGQTYILRMLIRKGNDEFKIPNEYLWVEPIVYAADLRQKAKGINQAFCYLTIRSGLVKSITDDEWHVDGFSMRITHIPEQSYGWANKYPTEYLVKPICFPDDFNPLIHNINHYIQSKITNGDLVRSVPDKTLFSFDPYIIHRRPYIPSNINRTFIRVSFTPIEINDINNTINPLLETNYTNDGISFRNKLERFNHA